MNIEEKAYNLLMGRHVRQVLETDYAIWFRVKSYNIRYRKATKGDAWTCECMYWVVKGKTCSHIRACQIAWEKLLSKQYK